MYDEYETYDMCRYPEDEFCEDDIFMDDEELKYYRLIDWE